MLLQMLDVLSDVLGASHVQLVSYAIDDKKLVCWIMLPV